MHGVIYNNMYYGIKASYLISVTRHIRARRIMIDLHSYAVGANTFTDSNHTVISYPLKQIFTITAPFSVSR